MPGPMDWYYKMSQKAKQQYPDVDLAWAQMQSQMPQEAAGVNKIRPMNWLEQTLMFTPNHMAVTYPNKTIAFNPAAMPFSKYGTNTADLMAHELKHVGQIQQDGTFGFLKRMFSQPKDYMARDYEQEAFAVEEKRKKRRTDIDLPKQKKKSGK